MSKNQKASGITNIISYDNSGNISFVSGSTTLMSVSSSGAVLLTNTMSGGVAVSASLSANSNLLEGTGSVGFSTTASLLAVSSSQQQISSSLLTLTASYTALSSSYIALSASYNTFSGSASTRITANSSSIQQVSSSQQQISASLLNVIANYATTGSNSFRANQSITGSLVVSSTITAQTLVVQTVTSSIVYSSGSNIFGSQLTDRQTFTGSIYITGSQTVFGNVGIGTTNPTAKLQVTPNNEAFADGVFINQAASNQATIRFKSAHSADSDYRIGASILVNNAFEIYSVNASASRVVLTNSGSLGIGTTTPTSPLTLAATSANFAFYNTFDNAQIRNWAIAMNYYNLGDMSFLQSTAQNGNPITAGTARLHLNYNGNVGIGTTNPSRKLHILSTDDTRGILIHNSSTTSYAELHFSGSREYRIGTGGSASSAETTDNFYIYDATASAHRLTMNSSGYVGIGTTGPTELLHVKGNIRAGNIDNATNFAGTSPYIGIGGSTPLFLVHSSGYGLGYFVYDTGGDRLIIDNDNGGGNNKIDFSVNAGTSTGGSANNVSGIAYAMRIDGSGRVTIPYQPAFKAGLSTSTSFGANSTIIFNDTSGNHFNTGGHYSTSTGMFTAPVAGKYIFSTVVIYQSMAAGQAMDDAFYIYKNSSLVAYSFRRAEYEAGYTGNNGYYTDHANILLNLAASDTVSIRNNRALDVHGNTNYCYFYGYMLG